MDCMKDVISSFHKAFYNSGVWVKDTKWMGVPIQKCPLDLWIYQEILYDVRPDLIIETGTYCGGSSLFLAQMCDLIGLGHIVSVDIEYMARPKHDRILYLLGKSIDETIIKTIENLVNRSKNILVILDSDHSCDYVLEEMKYYAPFVTPKSYLIIEDSNVNGHPVCIDHGPGPYEAIEKFIEINKDFEIDKSKEKFFMTQNPNGYLKRK